MTRLRCRVPSNNVYRQRPPLRSDTKSAHVCALNVPLIDGASSNDVGPTGGRDGDQAIHEKKRSRRTLEKRLSLHDQKLEADDGISFTGC